MTYSKYFIILLFFVSCEEAILFQEATDFHTIVVVSNINSSKNMTIKTQSPTPHGLSGYTRKHFNPDLFRIYLNDKELQAQRDYFISENKENNTNYFEIKKDLYVSLDNIHVKVTYEDISFEAWIKPLKKVEKASIEYYHDHCKWIPPEGDVASKIEIFTPRKGKQIVSKLSGTENPNFYIWEKTGKWKIFKSGQYKILTRKGTWVKYTGNYFYENTNVKISSYDEYAARYMFDGKLKGADNVIGNGLAYSYSVFEDTVRFLR